MWGGLSQQQVNGLNRLLTGIENDPHIPAPPIGIFYAAYMLATVKRETAHTFTPIHEYGGRQYFINRYGGQTRKGRELGNDTPEEGFYYAGKSDVQVTGESNYEKLEVALRREYPKEVAEWERRTGKVFDLTVGDQSNDTSDPSNILDPVLSYIAMSYGMRTGLYTGRRLSQYIVNGQPNYKGMRAIINGNDHDDEIAADARRFEKILMASRESLDDLLDDLNLDSAAASTSGQSPEAETQSAPVTNPVEYPTEPPPTQITATTETQTQGQTQTVEVSQKNEQDVNQTATVSTAQYQGVGFVGALKKDFFAIGGGNVTFQTLQEYFAQSQGWPPWVLPIITKLALVVAVLGAAWLLFRFGHYIAWKVGDWKRQAVEADINSDVSRKNIEFT